MPSNQARVGPRKRKSFPFSCDPQVIDRIQALADEQGRSRSGYIERILREHLEKLEKSSS